MRKALSLVALSLVLTATSIGPAVAGERSDRSVDGSSKTIRQQKELMAWLFGSNTNPLLQDNFCGERVNGVFFLNAAAVPDLEATCEIPEDTPLLGTPGGTISWSPTDATTDAGLIAERDLFLADISNPSATLDGRQLDLRFAKTDAYTIPVGADSLIKAVDPTFPPELTTTRVASAAWIVRISELRPGKHELVLRDEIAGAGTFTATFHITVVDDHD